MVICGGYICCGYIGVVICVWFYVVGYMCAGYMMCGSMLRCPMVVVLCCVVLCVWFYMCGSTFVWRCVVGYMYCLIICDVGSMCVVLCCVGSMFCWFDFVLFDVVWLHGFGYMLLWDICVILCFVGYMCLAICVLLLCVLLYARGSMCVVLCFVGSM